MSVVEVDVVPDPSLEDGVWYLVADPESVREAVLMAEREEIVESIPWAD